MLSAHLGTEVFLKGVSDYLNAHKFGNAKTTDLWSAVGKAAGQDVNGFMDNWIRKIGFPVLTVAEEPGQISVRQNRFLITGDVKPDEDTTTWWIPLGLRNGPQAQIHSTKSITTKEDTIREVDTSFYKINAENNGCYRTNYPPERLVKLGEAKDKLSAEDRIGLIGDAAAMATAGYGTTAGFLALVENFSDEKNYLVWSQIMTNLTSIRSIFGDSEDITKGLRAFTLKLTTPIAEKLGWDFPKQEDYLTGQLRALLIGAAGGAGHERQVANKDSYVGIT
jgi:aminopeptidase N